MTRPSMDSTVRDMLSEFFGYVDDERRQRHLDTDDIQAVFTGLALPDMAGAYSAWHDQHGSDDPFDDEDEPEVYLP